MILSQKNIEEIAVAVIRDFQKSFFGSEADDPARFALPTPIDQFASDYLNLKVSFRRRMRKHFERRTRSFRKRLSVWRQKETNGTGNKCRGCCMRLRVTAFPFTFSLQQVEAAFCGGKN